MTKQSFDLTDVELDKAAGGRPSLTDIHITKVADAVSPAPLPSAGETFSAFLAALLS